MSRAVITVLTVATAVLAVPSAASAAYDPNLHVDPSVDDCSVRFAPELTQEAFRQFAREFGSVSAFKQGAPPETLRPWHVALDVEQIRFTVDDKSPAWNDTFTHPDSSHELGAEQAFPKLRLRMGVTDDVDVGAYYAMNPSANYGWLGVEAKYAVMHQRDGAPFSLAVRGAYTKTLYVADMDMHAVTADVSIGRTFWKVLTPYLGLGSDVVLVRETSPAVALKDEALLVPRLTAGLEARWWHLGVGAEAHVAAITSYQLQISAVF
jgi:hypothetical protein